MNGVDLVTSGRFSLHPSCLWECIHVTSFHVKGKEKSSSSLLVRNRATIFVRSKFVLYFSTFFPNVEVSLSKKLKRITKIESLATIKEYRKRLASPIPEIFNYLARKFLASERRIFAIR
ncbi:hypothetical protein [Psychrobacillus sp.]|uniref:hypothetical protein n=1 Tax=Psychrobacillus sp. TaxID=1871623 RepID=UPI0028BF5AAF|nr:hypothetical protein [Psychrobacillus sp.]